MNPSPFPALSHGHRIWTLILSALLGAACGTHEVADGTAPGTPTAREQNDSTEPDDTGIPSGEAPSSQAPSASDTTSADSRADEIARFFASCEMGVGSVPPCTNETPHPSCPAASREVFWGDEPLSVSGAEAFAWFQKNIDERSPFVALKQRGGSTDEFFAPFAQDAAAATSMPAFFSAVTRMMWALQDGHSGANAEIYCGAGESDDETLRELSPSIPPRYGERPPVFWLEDRASIIGACITESDAGELLVYRASDDNAAHLSPGDELLGFDCLPWEELLPIIDSWKLPICGRITSSEESTRARRLDAIASNAHLFRVMHVRRADGTIETIDTSTVLQHPSWLYCTDRLDVKGVTAPCTVFGVCASDVPQEISGGIIEGTEIGYVHVNSYLNWDSEDFELNVAPEVREAEALIVDQREGIGGGPGTLLGALDRHSRTWLPEVVRDKSSPIGLRSHGWYDLMAKSRPMGKWKRIAFLMGPKMGSGGDIVPWALSVDPTVRLFGRPTDGRFGTAGRTYAADDGLTHPLKKLHDRSLS